MEVEGRRRRAIVLFPPIEDLVEVEAIRRRWDPEMTARVGPHVTLVHDVTDVARADDLLASVAASAASLELTLTTTACWGTAPNGIYLGVDDDAGAVRALHDALAPIEEPRWLRHPFRPHLTLVHGRTVDDDTAEAAWAALRDHKFGVRTWLDRISVIEMDDDGWTIVDEVELGADDASSDA